MTREEMFRQIVNEMATVYEEKHADYGGNFEELYAKFGILSSIIRFNDKLSRIENLTIRKKTQKVKNESVDDTLIDLANYSIMTLIERRLLHEKNMRTNNEQGKLGKIEVGTGGNKQPQGT